MRCARATHARALLLVLYGALQLAIAVAVLATGNRLVFAQSDPAAAAGLFIAQLFGNARHGDPSKG